MAVQTVSYHQLVCDDCGLVDTTRSRTATDVLEREEDGWFILGGYKYPGDDATFDDFTLDQISEEFGQAFRSLATRSRNIQPIDRRVLMTLESIANPKSGTHHTGAGQASTEDETLSSTTTTAGAPFEMIPAAVLDAGLTPQAFAVYVALCRHADNETRKTWVGRERLAAYIGAKQARAVDRYIKELIEAGLIESTPRYVNGRDKRDWSFVRDAQHPARGSNLYTITDIAAGQPNPKSGTHRTGKIKIARNFQDAGNTNITINAVEDALHSAHGDGYLVCISDTKGVSRWKLSTPDDTANMYRNTPTDVDPGIPDVSRIDEALCPDCHQASMARIVARAEKDGL